MPLCHFAGFNNNNNNNSLQAPVKIQIYDGMFQSKIKGLIFAVSIGPLSASPKHVTILSATRFSLYLHFSTLRYGVIRLDATKKAIRYGICYETQLNTPFKMKTRPAAFPPIFIQSDMNLSRKFCPGTNPERPISYKVYLFAPNPKMWKIRVWGKVAHHREPLPSL
jgi:hypothetical protein